MGTADAVVLDLERKATKALALLDALVVRNAELRAERDSLVVQVEQLRRAQRRIDGVRDRLERAEKQNRQLRSAREEALGRTRAIVRKIGLLDEDLGLGRSRRSEPVAKAKEKA